MRQAYAIAAVLAAVLTVGAQAATADGFQRGDVLASVGNPSVIARFAPDGTPKGVLADSAGAGPLCFDPSGEHLVAPGTGLYDSTGTRLASAWASVTPVGDCTVDKAGNVYLAGGPSTGDGVTGRGTIRKFDLTGHPLRQLRRRRDRPYLRRSVYSLDLAPDQCTIYYGLGGGEDVLRYDVCTNTQLPGFGSAGSPCDQLRVRANGEVAVTCDSHGGLLDTSGTRTHDFANASDPPNVSGRFAALDADGTSFWMGTSRACSRATTSRAASDRIAGPPARASAASPSTTRPAAGAGPRERRRLQHNAEHVGLVRRRHAGADLRDGLVGALARHARPRGRPTAGCSPPGARCCSTRACR